MRFAVLSLVLVLGLAPAVRAETLKNVENCAQRGDLDLRISGCTGVIDSGEWTGKNLALAYLSRGIAYNGLGEPRRALEDLDRALGLNPKSAEAYSARGNAYIRLGNPRRALQDLDRALRLDSGYVHAWSNRGWAWLELGEHARAVKNLDEALRLDPDHVAARNHRRTALANLGESARAADDRGGEIQPDPVRFDVAIDGIPRQAFVLSRRIAVAIADDPKWGVYALLAAAGAIAVILAVGRRTEGRDAPREVSPQKPNDNPVRRMRNI